RCTDCGNQPIASTSCLLRSRDGRFGKGDRLQPRVQDLDAEPANGAVQRLQTNFASTPAAPNDPLQQRC
ncbi:MAG: hypothetical protein HC769_28500, partial [Cyanobacteria bacterium CRU_2_1]|nr:hypothetical protein [Cyanobacteria bacterium CRU_2_1]